VTLEQAAPPRSRARGALDLSVLIGLVVLWFSLMRRFGEGDVYAVMGPYACCVSAVCVMLRPRQTLTWLEAHARAIAIGLAVGAVMTLLTYPIFRAAVSVMPSLEGQVQALYHGARSTTLAKALAWVAALALAEELLFRGVMPDALRSFTSERTAYAIATVIYALAQLGAGSVIVMLMALVCGTLWSIQRIYTRSLLSTLLAHLIWSPTVILFYPVT
jgi:membrane protease YdiL (CAAX protease family)